MTLNEGCYKVSNNHYHLLEIKNGVYTITNMYDQKFEMDVSYGDFGEAPEAVKEATGKNRLDIRLKTIWTEDMGEGLRELCEKFVEFGILHGSGFVTRGAMGVSRIEKITEEEKEEIMNNFDPIEAPPGPYKIQPEVQGKILWFSGAPGMGKSTTAQLLARENGYVYYEADCFSAVKNPYIPLDHENPSLAQLTQKSLKGPGVEERVKLGKIFVNEVGKVMAGVRMDHEAMFPLYDAMGKEILKEKQRIGGDWAIAHVVAARDTRDRLRNLMGSDLVFIILSMTQEDRRKRVMKRHENNEQAADMMDAFEKLCEPGQEDEPKTINISVTAEMSKDDVVKLVMKKLEEIEMEG